jgi:hypothetical protein
MPPTLTTTAEREIESPAQGSLSSIPQDVTSAQALIVNESARLIAEAVRNQARAIVLTGSMSRGETTLQNEGAVWRVLGDATFLVVFDGPVARQLAELERKIHRNLLTEGVNCKVVIVTSTADNLRAMKPHIYAYELKERGVVVWGDNNTLSLIPPFAAAEIPKEDGWWLLCNRMIEQIETAAASSNFNDDCTAVRYRIAKLYLAMAACYLLVTGRYEPSYQSRAARLREIAKTDSTPAPICLRRFSELVSLCTDLKLHGEMAVSLTHFPRWPNAVADAEAIWRWALAGITGLDVSVGREQLLGAVAREQSILARGKGWARVAYVRRSRLAREGIRWARMAVSSSPRYLVYGAASELLFMTQEPISPNSDQLAAVIEKLPISSKSSKQELSWNDVANQVADNFHALLENNRC